MRYILFIALIFVISACSEENNISNNPFGGETFIARGNEPGWKVVIYQDKIDVLKNYGEDKFTLNITEEATFKSETTIITTTDKNKNPVTISISEINCEDNMSGEQFDYYVTFEHNNETLKGCGFIEHQ